MFRSAAPSAFIRASSNSFFGAARSFTKQIPQSSSLISHIKVRNPDFSTSYDGPKIFSNALKEGDVFERDDSKNSVLMAFMSNRFIADRWGHKKIFLNSILEEVGPKNLKSFLNLQNKDGQTALMIGAKFHHATMAKTLFQQGADLYLTDNEGNNVLMLMALGSSFNAFKPIIDRYCASGRLNDKNHNGETAILIAINSGNYDFARELLEIGAQLPEVEVGRKNICVEDFALDSLYEKGTAGYEESYEAFKYVFWKISLESGLSLGIRKTLFASCEAIGTKDRWQKAHKMLDEIELSNLAVALEDLKKNTTYALMAKQEIENGSKNSFEIRQGVIYRDGLAITDSKGLVDLGLNLHNIVQLSKQWHRSNVRTVLSTLKDTYEEVWEPLFEGVVSIDLYGKRFNATCLSSIDQIQEEGDVLDHCVGNYSRSCLFGKSHLISITDQDLKRISTLHLFVNEDNDEVNILQHRGLSDNLVSEVITKVAVKLTKNINDGSIPVDFEKIEDERFRRVGIKESKIFEEIITEYLGYNPAKEGKMKKVLETYLEALCGPSEHKRLMEGKRVKPLARAIGDFILPMIEKLQEVPDVQVEMPKIEVVSSNQQNTHSI